MWSVVLYPFCFVLYIWSLLFPIDICGLQYYTLFVLCYIFGHYCFQQIYVVCSTIPFLFCVIYLVTIVSNRYMWSVVLYHFCFVLYIWSLLFPINICVVCSTIPFLFCVIYLVTIVSNRYMWSVVLYPFCFVLYIWSLLFPIDICGLQYYTLFVLCYIFGHYCFQQIYVVCSTIPFLFCVIYLVTIVSNRYMWSVVLYPFCFVLYIWSLLFPIDICGLQYYTLFVLCYIFGHYCFQQIYVVCSTIPFLFCVIYLITIVSNKYMCGLQYYTLFVLCYIFGHYCFQQIYVVCSTIPFLFCVIYLVTIVSNRYMWSVVLYPFCFVLYIWSLLFPIDICGLQYYTLFVLCYIFGHYCFQQIYVVCSTIPFLFCVIYLVTIVSNRYMWSVVLYPFCFVLYIWSLLFPIDICGLQYYTLFVLCYIFGHYCFQQIYVVCSTIPFLFCVIYLVTIVSNRYMWSVVLYPFCFVLYIWSLLFPIDICGLQYYTLFVLCYIFGHYCFQQIYVVCSTIPFLFCVIYLVTIVSNRYMWSVVLYPFCFVLYIWSLLFPIDICGLQYYTLFVLCYIFGHYCFQQIYVVCSTIPFLFCVIYLVTIVSNRYMWSVVLYPFCFVLYIWSLLFPIDICGLQYYTLFVLCYIFGHYCFQQIYVVCSTIPFLFCVIYLVTIVSNRYMWSVVLYPFCFVLYIWSLLFPIDICGLQYYTLFVLCYIFGHYCFQQIYVVCSTIPFLFCVIYLVTIVSNRYMWSVVLYPFCFVLYIWSLLFPIDICGLQYYTLFVLCYIFGHYCFQQIYVVCSTIPFLFCVIYLVTIVSNRYMWSVVLYPFCFVLYIWSLLFPIDICGLQYYTLFVLCYIFGHYCFQQIYVVCSTIPFLFCVIYLVTIVSNRYMWSVVLYHFCFVLYIWSLLFPIDICVVCSTIPFLFCVIYLVTIVSNRYMWSVVLYPFCFVLYIWSLLFPIDICGLQYYTLFVLCYIFGHYCFQQIYVVCSTIPFLFCVIYLVTIVSNRYMWSVVLYPFCFVLYIWSLLFPIDICGLQYYTLFVLCYIFGHYCFQQIYVICSTMPFLFCVIYLITIVSNKYMCGLQYYTLFVLCYIFGHYCFQQIYVVCSTMPFLFCVIYLVTIVSNRYM